MLVSFPCLARPSDAASDASPSSRSTQNARRLIPPHANGALEGRPESVGVSCRISTGVGSSCYWKTKWTPVNIANAIAGRQQAVASGRWTSFVVPFKYLLFRAPA